MHERLKAVNAGLSTPTLDTPRNLRDGGGLHVHAGPALAAGNPFPVDYRVESDLNADQPGLYTLTVTYTVTTP
jgi:hypothetical protein